MSTDETDEAAGDRVSRPRVGELLAAAASAVHSVRADASLYARKAYKSW